MNRATTIDKQLNDNYKLSLINQDLFKRGQTHNLQVSAPPEETKLEKSPLILGAKRYLIVLFMYVYRPIKNQIIISDLDGRSNPRTSSYADHHKRSSDYSEIVIKNAESTQKIIEQFNKKKSQQLPTPTQSIEQIKLSQELNTPQKSNSGLKSTGSKLDYGTPNSYHPPPLPHGSIKDTSSNSIFTQNKFGMGVLRDDRRTSKILMIPTIKGIAQRKQAEERQEEFLRSYYEKRGRSFLMDESITSKVSSRPTSAIQIQEERNENSESSESSEDQDNDQSNQVSNINEEQDENVSETDDNKESMRSEEVIKLRIGAEEEYTFSSKMMKANRQGARANTNLDIKFSSANVSTIEKEERFPKRPLSNFKTQKVREDSDQKLKRQSLGQRENSSSSPKKGSPIKLGQTMFIIENKEEEKASNEIKLGLHHQKQQQLRKKLQQRKEQPNPSPKRKQFSSQQVSILGGRIVTDKKFLPKGSQSKFETSINLNELLSENRKYRSENKKVDRVVGSAYNSELHVSPFDTKEMENLNNPQYLQAQFQIKYKGYFTIDSKSNKGVKIQSNKQITDEVLFDFLLSLNYEKIYSLTLPNCMLSDAGATILFEYLKDKFSLRSLKIYNNIMVCLNTMQEVPMLLTGTYQLAETLKNKRYLTTLELHGFFFHQDDVPFVFQSLSSCNSLKRLSLSNNNIQDYGVSYLARVLANPKSELEYLTIYNNNIGDDGALYIVDALDGNKHIKHINLQMNFIKDVGAGYFVDALRENAFANIQKIILSENHCTERMKKYINTNFNVIAIQTPLFSQFDHINNF